MDAKLPLSVALRRVSRGQILPARGRDGDRAVARLVSGRLVVLPDECPHDGGRISDGFVDGERIVCTRHNREFDVCEGSSGSALVQCKLRE